jgi:DNA-binding transcriptional LysR family regulator
MRISLVPLRLAGLLQRCDLAFCHGLAGHARGGAAARCAGAVDAMPFEQYLMGRCAENLGAGLTVKPDEIAPDFGLLLWLLAEPEFKDGTRIFAARHADHDLARQCEAMAERIGEILKT